MTTEDCIGRVFKRVAVLAAVCIDCALFLGPRTHGMHLFGLPGLKVYMFRVEAADDYALSCTNRATFWLPMWDCHPEETLQYGLFAGIALCGVALVLSRRPREAWSLAWALFSMQAVATAAALFEVAGGWIGSILALTWAPLLLAVAFQRAPALWKRTMARWAAVVFGAAVAFGILRWARDGEAGNEPTQSRASWVSLVLGTWWCGQQLVAVPVLAGVVRLVRAPSSGAVARRVGGAVGGVALVASAVAVASEVASVVRGGPDGYDGLPVPEMDTMALVVGALALTAIAALWPARAPGLPRASC